MKTAIMALTLFILLFLNNNANSQSQWITQTSNILENLNDVYFVSVNTGYAAGNNGKVLKTVNQGTTWSSLTFPGSGDNLSIYFTSSTTGYVGSTFNNYLYKTTNGGTNWTIQTTMSANPVTSIKFTSTTAGWAGVANSNNILKTTNSGTNWDIIGYVPGTNAKVFFLNNDRGWFADSFGYITFTTNSGNNFTSVKVSSKPLNSAFFISSTMGYTAGDSGRVYRTTDGGSTWMLLNTGTTSNLKSITGNVVNSTLRLWAVGAGGKIIESYDWGNTWIQQNVGISDLNSVTFPSVNIGFAVGNTGKILFTNLTSNPLPACIGSENSIIDYPFTTYYMDARTDILFTASEISQNGGQTGNITKIGFSMTSFSNQIMHGFQIKMQYVASTSLYGFTNNGWDVVYSGDYSVSGTGFQNITLQNPYFWNATGNLLVEICFNNSGWTANSNIYGTSATGMTWSQSTDLPSGDGCAELVAGTVRNIRPNICFSIQTLSGENNGNSSVPEKFSLYQNYPNPFNPTTKIRFDIPETVKRKTLNVKLIVYDVLGKEITTLVNEELNTGSYIIDWNASDYPSGVYFYKLETEGYTNVKRMILVK